MIYPNFAVDVKSSEQQPVEDLVVDQWPNGGSRGRSYFTTGRYSWVLNHTVLADADRVTLKAFYDANRLLLFDFVSPWDGVTYHNVGFLSPPPKYEKLPGGYWNVKVALRQFI